jgi:class 3 adenylate cyclase
MVTLLFSDVEGSTGLVQRLGESTYAASLTEHRALCQKSLYTGPQLGMKDVSN